MNPKLTVGQKFVIHFPLTASTLASSSYFYWAEQSKPCFRNWPTSAWTSSSKDLVPFCVAEGFWMPFCLTVIGSHLTNMHRVILQWLLFLFLGPPISSTLMRQLLVCFVDPDFSLRLRNHVDGQSSTQTQQHIYRVFCASVYSLYWDACVCFVQHRNYQLDAKPVFRLCLGLSASGKTFGTVLDLSHIEIYPRPKVGTA